MDGKAHSTGETKQARPERRLVITADDFGASAEVNAAVELAHLQGVLTAASLMVSAPAADQAVEAARRLTGLAVGLHLVLVEGRPILPPDRLPALVDRDGGFRTDMAAAGATIFFSPAARAQLRAEIEAQFEAFAATGLTLDHVNAHKHFHLHPTIAGTILKVGRRYGLAAARLPIEPASVLDLAEPGVNHRPALITEPWARLARARFRRAGIAVPDQVFGLAWSGAMNEARLLGLIRSLPPGLTEIYLHPATRGGYPGSAAGYGYADELAALTSARVIAAARGAGLILGGFRDLA